MLTINANVDKTSLNKTIHAMAQFGKAQGLTVRFVCWDVLRAWTLDMIKRSAPWADKGTVGTFAQQKITGKGAIDHDIDRAFSNADDYIAFDQGGQKFLRVKLTGAVFPIKAEQWNPSTWISSMRSKHLSLRNSRGRVPRQKDENKSFVRGGAIEEYKSDVKERVGELKAGFIPGLYHFASLCSGSLGRLPQWILGQSLKEGGYGGTMDASGSGSIYVENTAHHSNAIRRDTAEWSRNFQQRNLTKFGKVRLQRLCDQFNAGQSPQFQPRAAP